MQLQPNSPAGFLCVSDRVIETRTHSKAGDGRHSITGRLMIFPQVHAASARTISRLKDHVLRGLFSVTDKGGPCLRCLNQTFALSPRRQWFYASSRILERTTNCNGRKGVTVGFDGRKQQSEISTAVRRRHRGAVFLFAAIQGPPWHRRPCTARGEQVDTEIPVKRGPVRSPCVWKLFRFRHRILSACHLRGNISADADK